MDSTSIIAKAKEYIFLEKNTDFRNEVDLLLENNDIEELSDRFYRNLNFGTGGLRGIIGGGFNRMNPFMVQRTTQGLANYIQKNTNSEDKSAVIAYDSRRYSALFALEAALVFCGNNIRTYLFSDLRPTPELSYAVRTLSATAGIVVTASHNPPEYNGYKVYWSDGGQIVPPHDSGIIDEVLAVTDKIKRMEKSEAERKGLLRLINSEIDLKYLDMIKNKIIRPSVFEDNTKSIRVVYTALHGTGSVLIPGLLEDLGVKVDLVEEQAEPDENFSTVDFPNPEEASAMHMALVKGRQINADLIMGTDPDADRIGIAVPDKGDFTLITGNQLGALLADYVFSGLKKTGKLPKNPAFVKTIVTTELQKKIAQKYGAVCFDVLTGFKYIAEKIENFGDAPESPAYVFGGEESYGFLYGAEVRDKDAVSTAILTVEMTLFLASQGKSLMDRLNELYTEFGYYREILISRVFKGEKGSEIMGRVIGKLRENPPCSIGGVAVAELRDYLSGMTLNLNSGEKVRNLDLPSSNVLQFLLDDETIISVRPSGTEPKIKFYASCTTKDTADLGIAREQASNRIELITLDIERLVDPAHV
jgi:phosphoglucomutase